MIVKKLQEMGVTERSALAKGELLGRCIAALGGRQPAFTFFVPGRLEFLGKHTDYCGGRSVVAAVDRGFVIAVRPCAGRHVIVHACDLNQRFGFDFSPELQPANNGWTNYVTTVAQRLASNFGAPLEGAEIAFASDLPQAAGMSSSSALLVGMYLALNAVNRFETREDYRSQIRRIEDLAGYLGTCENGQSFGTLRGAKGVGTFGGSEDHTAILCSQQDMLGVYTYAPVRLEQRVFWPREMALLIASSGVVAEKTAAAKDRYNRISLLARAVLEVLREGGWDKPTLAAAIGDDREAEQCARRIIAEARHPQYKSAELLARFEQFAMEHQKLIPAAIDAIGHKDWPALTEAVESSQNLAERNLGNQIPQTVALVRSARKLGAVAASAFGAGFGGSVWAMVPKDQAPGFSGQWAESYRQAFPANQGLVFQTGCVGGATLL
jgi:galactokinase